MPFAPQQVEALVDFAARLAPTPMVLIGAAAVGCHVPMDWRRTEDLDLVVAIELEG